MIATAAPLTIDWPLVRQYATLPIEPVAGCSCKLPGKHLAHAITKCFGGYDPEDAATIQTNAGKHLMTIDGGLPVHSNSYVASYTALIHAASDIYAVGGKPLFVASFLQISADAEGDGLDGFLAGARDASRHLMAQLVTGHTIRGATTVLAFAVFGEPHSKRVLSKTGAKPGEGIYLSKPLGTGVLIRGRAEDRLSAEEDEELAQWMAQSNREAMEAALKAGVTASTDVTGFGLVGHLAEMLEGMGAELDMKSLPYLLGARELASEIGGSTWTAANLAYARSKFVVELDEEESILLADPQTSGGLLVTCSDSGQEHLIKGGFTRIGTVISPEMITQQ